MKDYKDHYPKHNLAALRHAILHAHTLMYELDIEGYRKPGREDVLDATRKLALLAEDIQLHASVISFHAEHFNPETGVSMFMEQKGEAFIETEETVEE